MYEYIGTVLRVVDGDTVHVNVDLGCDVHINLTLRLLGINAPEMSTPRGPLSKTYVETWVADHAGTVVVKTVKDHKEKYGRYLAEVFPAVGADRTSLNQRLLDGGFAVPYPK